MRPINGKLFSACVLSAVFAGASVNAEYDKASLVPLNSAMHTTCTLGNAPLSAGSTPTSIAGVTIVSAQQAKCLVDKFPASVLVIGAMNDTQQLPDAYAVPSLSLPTQDAKFTKAIATEFTPLTGGNKARPIIIYCHHASCQYSANGAEHLVNLGYTRVYWLRDGTSGWSAAGYALSKTYRYPLGTADYILSYNKSREFVAKCTRLKRPSRLSFKSALRYCMGCHWCSIGLL